MAANKKLVLLGLAAILLVAVIATIAVNVSHHPVPHSSPAGSGGSSGDLEATAKAVHSICQPTDYKDTCETTLTAAAGNTTDPKELVKLAFRVAEQHVREGLEHSSLILAVEKDRLSREALETCWELLDYAIDDLNSSLDRLGDMEISKLADAMDDIRVWLSSARTYQETCLDGFEGAQGTAGDSMRNALKTSTELTANVIAIVDEISQLLGQFNMAGVSRRLLSDGGAATGTFFPSWLLAAKRRLLGLAPWELKPNVVVAQDGRGDCKTINEALLAVPSNRTDGESFVIYIKEGVYSEIINITRNYTDLVMVGDGPTKTKITGSLSVSDIITTYQTATFGVSATGFIAKDLWFENSAGPEKHQAVAVRVQSDMSVFYNCRMDGYQDTLYAHSKRQFYRDCTISGTVDFIFGNAPAVFQNCAILVRKPLANQQNIVAAHGRTERVEATAIVLHNCTVSAAPDFYPLRRTIPTYLGRPWKPYARTFVVQSQLDDLIDPQGWLAWNGAEVGQRTCFYAELDNRGAGADTTGRATWRGVKKISYEHAQQFGVEKFISGNKWLPKTGVPFVPGLLPLAGADNV